MAELLGFVRWLLVGICTILLAFDAACMVAGAFDISAKGALIGELFFAGIGVGLAFLLRLVWRWDPLTVKVSRL